MLSTDDEIYKSGGRRVLENSALHTLPKRKLMAVTEVNTQFDRVVIDAIMCSVILNRFTFIIVGAFIKYVLTQQNQFIDVFCLP